MAGLMSDNQSRQFNDLGSTNVILASFLATFVISLGLRTTQLLIENDGKTKLQDDPMCGTTTGGSEECTWDCERNIFEFGLVLDGNVSNVPSEASVLAGQTFSDPLCMEDCFAPDHCISQLLNDYRKAGGVCFGTQVIEEMEEFQFVQPGVCEVLPPNGNFFLPLGINVTNITIVNGICSAETETALMTPECILDTALRRPSYFETILRLLYITCRTSVALTWINPDPAAWFGWFNPTGKRSEKLNPINAIVHHPVIGEVAKWTQDFNHTKHRYPWLCSLRSKDSKKTHFCAATMLRRPPGPTIFVTTAHCTFLCKSDDDRILPNCCCENVSGQRCLDTQDCGQNPRVEEMKGTDAEIICGEWEIGDASQTSSGELYNIIFQITEIRRHPGFQISRGTNQTQFVKDDIATIHVVDLDKQVFDDKKLFPACLPQTNSHKLDKPKRAIHAGWSTPPPVTYVQNNAPYHLPYYRDFRKLWHYRMDVEETCMDPLVNEINGLPLQFPSNTYYPPGLICAKEHLRHFCPSSGESGSPLMTKRNGSFVAEGILSFIKGCGAFAFDTNFAGKTWLLDPANFGLQYSSLYQQSNNPPAYTKLVCYLPWIAQQYGLTFEISGDPSCSVGHGNASDVTDFEARNCRSSPSTYTTTVGNTIPLDELPCIFPFFLDGNKINYDCVQLGNS